MFLRYCLSWRDLHFDPSKQNQKTEKTKLEIFSSNDLYPQRIFMYCFVSIYHKLKEVLEIATVVQCEYKHRYYHKNRFKSLLVYCSKKGIEYLWVSLCIQYYHLFSYLTLYQVQTSSFHLNPYLSRRYLRVEESVMKLKQNILQY